MLIGFDGLHPNAAGYQRIADTFFAAIKDSLETRPTTSTERRRFYGRPAVKDATELLRHERRDRSGESSLSLPR